MKRNRRIVFASMLVLVTATGLFLWSPSSPGQGPAKPAVMPWEYRTLFGTVGVPNDDDLNRLGKDGFELSAIRGEDSGRVRFVLKRPSQK
jgi:hypothetical protein